MKNVGNKSVVILGAARSGLAAARLLNKKGARVFVSDHAAAEDKQAELNILKNEGIKFEFGTHSEKIFEADFVVLSPGIQKTSAIVKNIMAKRISLYSELEVAYWFCKSPIIAITGSNGKTTTTSLLGEMLKAESPGSIVAGNIGDAFSDHVEESKESDWAVVEVSSFQLETIDTFHPQIVILLNLAPNHLDWYKSYNDYVNAKMLIMKNLNSNDYLIFNKDDSLLSEKVENCPARKLTFSLSDAAAGTFLQDNTLFVNERPLIATEEIKLRGFHNYQNSMAASLAAILAGIKKDTIKKVLREFKGIEHRLEFVTEINGVFFINDSKATTVESLAVALTSFESPIILIAGGKDKGSDYSKLNQLIIENTKHVVLIGAAKSKMAKAWDKIISLHPAETLTEAIEKAFDLASPGDNILLSPACSSFDMFKDFEDRGRSFKEIVRQLKNKYENK